MKLARTIVFLLLLPCGGAYLNAQVDESRYAWEFSVVRQVQGADALVATLRAEIQRILDAGRLSPLYLSTSDQDSVGYTLYN